MNKKSVIMFSIFGAVRVLICLPLIYIENRRAYYNKWGELAVLAETDERAKFIIENEELYPQDILNIYFSESDYLDFVYEYPFHKDDYANMSYTEKELNSDTVPALYMIDSRWAYEDNCRVRVYGCAAVSISMASLYLTHDTCVDPVKIMRYADDMGYIGIFGGITDEYTADLCKAFGLNVKITRYSENREKTTHANFDDIKSILDNGHVIMAGMAGDTFGVHAIIIKGYSGDKLYINDPASPEKTEKMWRFDDIEPELMYIYDLYI